MPWILVLYLGRLFYIIFSFVIFIFIFFNNENHVFHLNTQNNKVQMTLNTSVDPP